MDYVARFSSTGGLISGTDLANRMHARWIASGFVPIDQDPVSCLARWIVSGHVMSMESPWGRLVPMLQFDQVSGTQHPCMLRLLGILRPVLDENDTALWFVTPNHWINDTCPAHAMHGNPQQVLMAARLDRQVACAEGDPRTF